ncbi:MAG TPA: ABC transporter substrate-binding protein [Chloroflexota bacterium]|nr:ABC transporter substrate-binding protein [Chloroflexota bacterium]
MVAFACPGGLARRSAVLALAIATLACGMPTADRSAGAPAVSEVAPAPSAPPPATAQAPAGSAAAGPSLPLEPAAIKFGHVGATPYAAVYVAAEKGYFQERGISVDFERTQSSAEAVPLVSAGQVQATGAGYGASFFNAYARGVDLIMVAPIVTTPTRGDSPAPVVARRDLVDSGAVRGPGDLRGRKVGVLATGGYAEYSLMLALRMGGLTIDDVDLVTLPLPDMPTALANQNLDAAWTPEPFGTLIEQRDIGRKIATTHDLGEEQSALVMNTQWMRAHPDAAANFMVGYLKGARDLWGPGWKDPANVAIMHKYTDVPVDTIMRSPDSYTDPDGKFNVGSIERLQQYLLERGYLQYKEPIPISQLIDDGPARRAVEQLGPFDRDQ